MLAHCSSLIDMYRHIVLSDIYILGRYCMNKPTVVFRQQSNNTVVVVVVYGFASLLHTATKIALFTERSVSREYCQ